MRKSPPGANAGAQQTAGRNKKSKTVAISAAAVSLAVAITAGVFQLVAEYSVIQWVFGRSTDQPAPAREKTHNWNTQYSPTNVAGVHASGVVRQTGDGRLHLTGSLKDTERDSRGGALKIEAHYADGGVQRLTDYVGGAGQLVNIGGAPAGRSFPENVTRITVTECLTIKDEVLREETCGAAPLIVWGA